MIQARHSKVKGSTTAAVLVALSNEISSDPGPEDVDPVQILCIPPVQPPFSCASSANISRACAIDRICVCTETCII